MHILFSAYNFTTKVYLESVAKTHDVSVFQNNKSILEKPDKVKIIKVDHAFHLISPVPRIMKVDRVPPEYILNFKKVFPESKPDILCAIEFYNFTFWQFLRYKKIHSDTKLFVWSETRAWPQFWLSRWVMYVFWWYFKRNLNHVEKVFVFTDEGKKFFNTYAPEVVVEVFPAPIDSRLFSFNLHKKYLPDAVLRIIMNARYIPLKEHRTLFKAAKILKIKNIAFEISLIGRGGHLENELKANAKEIGIGELIQWIEPVPSAQLNVIYSEHDVLVLPSNREAIGMVVPEAMACGLATVTSGAVGANVYVEQGETGLIFKTGNAEALASALEQLADRSKVEMYGHAAAKIIREQYSLDVLGDKLLKALE